MKNCFSLFNFAALMLASIPMQASVVNVSDVTIGSSSYRAFQDTTTSLVWLDLDNFFASSETYNSISALLVGSDFHLATLSELQTLQASIPAVPANFLSEAAVIGGNYPGSSHATGARQLIWGLYDDGNAADGVGYSWRFDSDTSWNTSANSYGAATDLASSNAPPYQDLGVWVVGQSQSVPEPGTAALFALGIAGAAVSRWRKRSDVSNC